MNHFRELFYHLKFKKRFVSWMWKSREIKIREQFHPKHLYIFLQNNEVSEDNNELIDAFLNQWN